VEEPHTAPAVVPLTKEEAVQELARLIVERMCKIQYDLFEFENNVMPQDRLDRIIGSANYNANKHPDPIAEVERLKKCNAEDEKKKKLMPLTKKPRKMIPNSLTKPVVKPVPIVKSVSQEKEDAVKEIAKMIVESLSALWCKI